MEPGLRRRLGQRRRARGSRKATWPAPRRCCSKALDASIPSSPRRTSSSARRSRASAGTTRRSTHLRTAAAQYPRDRVVLQSDRPRAVPEAPVPGRRSTSFEQVLRDRSRGSAGALQPDALLSRARADRRGADATRRSTSASRPTRRRRPSPGPYRQLHPDDNNERQSIHEHATGAEPALTTPHSRRPRGAAPKPADAPAGGGR